MKLGKSQFKNRLMRLLARLTLEESKLSRLVTNLSSSRSSLNTIKGAG